MKTLDQARRQFSQPPTTETTPIHETIAKIPETKSEMEDLSADPFDEAEHHLRHIGGGYPLRGMTIAFTGRLSRTRKEFMKLVTDAGGRASHHINMRIDLLVVGDLHLHAHKSDKLKKAHERDIDRCSESDLIAMIMGE